jgi:hypothetical protein
MEGKGRGSSDKVAVPKQRINARVNGSLSGNRIR